MTNETKAEMVVAAVGVAFLLWLWNRNVQEGGGTGITLPPWLDVPRRTHERTAFDVGPGVQGASYTYSPGDISYAPNLRLGLDGASGGCNCASNANGEATFGSNADLSNWLINQPNLMDMSLQGLEGWY
jgi:hypothetical protein